MRRVLTKMSVVRCAVDQLGQAVVDLLPDLARHHRFERRRRELRARGRARAGGRCRRSCSRRRRRRPAAPTRKRATSSIGFCVADRPMRSSRSAAQRRQALERQRQVRAALVRRQRVDLVDDHGARGREHRAARLRAEQDVERLRRGDDDVRRAAAHAVALACGRVAGAHPGADVDVGQALRAAAPRGCRRAALRGCAGCRSTAP